MSDKFVTITLPNGQEIEYREIPSGTYFRVRTCSTVRQILEHFRLYSSGHRLRLYYGDAETGKASGECEKGYIGRSLGPVKVPILIPCTRSHHGTSIFDDQIVKIERSNENQGPRLIWQHPNFHITF
jgi:hypothetical protein